MVTTRLFGLFAAAVAITSSCRLATADQDTSKPSSLIAASTKRSVPKYDAGTVAAGGSSDEGLAEAPSDDERVDYSTLLAEESGSSGADERIEASGEEELAEPAAEGEAAESTEPIDWSYLSGEKELADASGEEELVDPATDELLVDTPVEDEDSTDPVREVASIDSLGDDDAVNPAIQQDMSDSSPVQEELSGGSGDAYDEELTENLAPEDASAAAGSAVPVASASPTPTLVVQTVAPTAVAPAPVATNTTKVSAASTPKPTTKAPTPAPVPSPAPVYKPPPVVVSLPNWIGTKSPTDKACYRKTHRTKKCPPGYEFDKIATCWAECPVEYPVECGMECIPQNKDCALAVLDKVNAVATVALNAATSGVFGKLVTASKGVQRGVKCGQQLFSATNKVVGYAKELGVKFPNTTKSQVQYLLSKSDFAVYDLPMAVTTCLGLPMPTSLAQAPQVTEVIKKLLEKVTVNGESILAPSSFIEVTQEVGAGESVSGLKAADMSELTKLIGSGVTCGAELKSIVDRVTMAVQEMKTTSPTSPVDAIRLAISSSDLFLKDIPAVTSSCVPKDATNAFQTRDDIRKTLKVMIDQVFDASSSGDKPLSKAEYALKMTDMGLDAVAMLDPTGIASMAQEFIQPICGPTSFLGEVDDGALDQALGLRTVGKAFAGSSGTWTKAGDGVLKITFESSDKKNVKVNIMSGGNKIDEVSVKKGATVTWTKPLAEMKDKTMYLDRWRPGLFGLPGTGGGSLLLWVPHTSKGGHLELRAKINVS